MTANFSKPTIEKEEMYFFFVEYPLFVSLCSKVYCYSHSFVKLTVSITENIKSRNDINWDFFLSCHF